MKAHGVKNSKGQLVVGLDGFKELMTGVLGDSFSVESITVSFQMLSEGLEYVTKDKPQKRMSDADVDYIISKIFYLIFLKKSCYL